MTVTPIKPAPAEPTRVQAPGPGKLKLWLKRHWKSLLLVCILMIPVGLASWYNLKGFPGTVNDDEGTYVDQAWAVLYQGHLAHYTYWYDHPPLGWMQISGYAWLTNGFGRSDYAVMMGREYMAVINMVASALVYVIMRRLKFNRVIASVAVLLFAVSPVAIYYHRLVFLDNIQVVWMLAAMALAVSPRRSLASAIGAGFCLTLSTLSKETGGIAIVVILVLLWQNLPKGRYFRVKGLTLFVGSYFMTSAFYVGMAILKGELVPGKGHVSLTHALWWQTFGRGSTGTPFEKGSETWQLVHFWLDWDHWLILAGLALIIPGLLFRRTRAFAIGNAIQWGLMFKGGYVPKAYAIQILPFSALLVAGFLGELCRWIKVSREEAKWTRIRKRSLNIVGLVLAASLIGSFAITAAPQWKQGLTTEATRDSTKHLALTKQWIEENVPKDAHLIVDDNLWLDIKNAGYTHVDWLYKPDADPAVKRNYPDGYNSVDYLIIDRLPIPLLKAQPTIYDAITHSKKVHEQGNNDVYYTVYKVIHPDWYERKPHKWYPAQ